jgi:predicted  nucleic acid-binding Zn-ribbon protein
MTQRETELEHELSAALIKVDDQRELLRLAKEENEEKRKDIVWTMGERAKLMDRIKQLEDIISVLQRRFRQGDFRCDAHNSGGITMSDHIGDTNEMSDTPISDSTPHNVAELGMLCRTLERLASVRLGYIQQLEIDIERLTQKVAELYAGAEEQKQRIKQLEDIISVLL